MCLTEIVREVIEAYGEAILELAKNIGEKIAESMGLEGNDYFKDWSSQFWINKYSFTPESVGKIGVQTHTDASFLTILQDDENVGGLQVMDHSGNSLVEAPPRPGTIVVILGDIAHVSIFIYIVLGILYMYICVLYMCAYIINVIYIGMEQWEIL